MARFMRFSFEAGKSMVCVISLLSTVFEFAQDFLRADRCQVCSCDSYFLTLTSLLLHLLWQVYC